MRQRERRCPYAVWTIIYNRLETALTPVGTIYHVVDGPVCLVPSPLHVPLFPEYSQRSAGARMSTFSHCVRVFHGTTFVQCLKLCLRVSLCFYAASQYYVRIDASDCY